MEVIFLTRNQGQTFLFYLATGLLVGGLYTLFSVVRFLLGGNKKSAFVTDIAWGIASGAIIASVGTVINNGEVRAYTIVAIIIGLGSYLFFVQKPLAKRMKIAYTFYAPKVASAQSRHANKRMEKFERRLVKRNAGQCVRAEKRAEHRQRACAQRTEKQKCLQEEKTKKARQRQPPSTTAP